MAAARAAARASSSWGPAVAVIAPAAVPVGPPPVVWPLAADAPPDVAPAEPDAAPAGDDAVLH